jgi:hypothetical protein
MQTLTDRHRSRSAIEYPYFFLLDTVGMTSSNLFFVPHALTDYTLELRLCYGFLQNSFFSYDRI